MQACRVLEGGDRVRRAVPPPTVLPPLPPSHRPTLAFSMSSLASSSLSSSTRLPPTLSPCAL